MKNRNMIKAALCLGLGLSIVFAPVASAKEVLLAKTKLQHKGEAVKAEIWGNKIAGGYAKDLMIILKREDKSVITGYKPDIAGGYGFNLKAVQVEKKDGDTEQLLLGIRQGDWKTYSEYRILDFRNPKDVKEIFAGPDSFGIVTSAKLEDNVLKVTTVRDLKPINVELNKKLIEDIAENRRKVEFGGLTSLTCIDINKDGITEIITNQQIRADKKTLVDVGAVWHYIGKVEKQKPEEDVQKDSEIEETKEESLMDMLKSLGKELEKLEQEKQQEENEKNAAKKEGQTKEKLWRQDNLTIMKADAPNRKNTINDGAYFNGGMVFPVKMIAPNGEATYPQIMLNNNEEVQEALNKLLWEEAEKYIRLYLRGKADLAYNVIRKDSKLLTIQLISGKDTFVHHNINIIPGEKKKTELKDILDVKSKDLVELLNVLNNNSKITWDSKLTNEWYTREDNLYLMKNVNGIDEVSGYDMNNLKRYIKHKNFLPDKEDKKAKKS